VTAGASHPTPFVAAFLRMLDCEVVLRNRCETVRVVRGLVRRLGAERRRAPVPIAVVGAAAVLVIAGAGAAGVMHSSNTPPLSPDGEVVGLTVARGKVYVQGAFSRFGPYTGSFALISRLTARRLPTVGAGEVSGDVEAVVSDGRGGWFLGGLFDHVGSVACENLAHLNADGQLDQRFCLDPDRVVDELALEGKTLYVGGAFDNIGGKQRNLIASLDADTGAINPWHPSARGDHVEAIAATGSVVYVGGRFTALGGAPRRDLAALDARTGNALPWNPQPNDLVFDITPLGSSVFVGGGFTRVDDESRLGVAAIDAQTGHPTTWRADTAWSKGTQLVIALTGSESTLYMGGIFDHVGGLPRDGLAAVDSVSGAVRPWRPPVSADAGDLFLAGDTVYAGGFFASPNNENRKIGSLLAINADTGALEDWKPDPNDTVNAVVVAGDSVAAGGAFVSVGDAQPRPCLAAITPAAGLTPWQPRIVCDPLDVVIDNGIAISGQDVFAVAEETCCKSFNKRLTVIDARTGRVKRSLSIPADPGAFCCALAAVGSRLYIGSVFNRIAGMRRPNLAALDRTSLRALPWNPRANGGIDSLAASRETVWVAGTFTRIGGARRARLAALDTRSGQAKAWNPHVNGHVTSITRSGSTIYLLGTFTKVGNVLRPDGLAAVDAVTGRPTSWKPQLPRHASGPILVTGAAVYVVLEQSRSRTPAQIIALNRRSGAELAWKPEAPDAGFFSAGNRDAINALAASRGRLIIGGAFQPYLVTTPLAHSSRRR
jgi:trimeric autotransporter adhesin